MEIFRQPCHPSLRRLVRSFSQRRLSLKRGVLTSSLPARPDQFIEFYLAERYGISRDGGPLSLAPESAVVGPQSRPGLRLHMSGDIDVFTIRFQPTGLHRLFRVPMPTLVDQGVSLADVIGRGAIQLDGSVRRAKDFSERVAAAEHWLMAQSERGGPPTELDRAARLLVAARGRVRIDVIAARSMLGPRQFHRRFTAAVGVTPKVYARTLRLENALDARRRHPERDWTRIVHAAGYADQAHFIRDCRALAGMPPTSFMAQHVAVTETFNPGPAATM